MNKIIFSSIENYNLKHTRISNYLESIKKFNVFIGKNNSGKSRLLRHIFSTFYDVYTVNRMLNDYLENIEYSENAIKVLTEVVNHYSNEINQKYTKFYNYNITLKKLLKSPAEFDKTRDIILAILNDVEIFENNHKLPLESFRNNTLSSLSEIKNIKDSIRDSKYRTSLYFPVNRTFKSVLNTYLNINFTKSKNYHDYDLDSIMNAFITDVSKLHDIDYDDVVKHKCIDDYFLDKNSIRKLQYIVNSKTPYVYTQNSNSQKNTRFREHDIITGYSLYKEIKDKLLGSNEDRKEVHCFQEFISEKFFNNQGVTIIPKESINQVTIKIGENPVLSISQIGDGLQQLILMLFPIYFNKDNFMDVFIEEPELYMHPDLIRRFVKVLMEMFPNHRYFITTHSATFLDLLSKTDSTIFTFTQNDKLEIEVSKTEASDIGIMNELGMKPSTMFLSNCSIWLEGISDLRYINKYLKLYSNKYQFHFEENIHYSFAFYGGSNYKHFNFSDGLIIEGLAKFSTTGLSKNILVISDSDYANNKVSKKVCELSKELGSNFYNIEGNTIESTLSPLQLSELLNRIKKIKSEINISDGRKTPKNKPIGKSIEKILKDHNCEQKVIDNISKKGVLDNYYKMKFSIDLDELTSMRNYDELSPSAKNLTKKIVDFITSNND